MHYFLANYVPKIPNNTRIMQIAQYCAIIFKQKFLNQASNNWSRICVPLGIAPPLTTRERRNSRIVGLSDLFTSMFAPMRTAVFCACFTWSDGQSTCDQIMSNKRSKCRWSNCVLCIPSILSGSPNKCWLHTCTVVQNTQCNNMEIRIAGSSCHLQ